MYGIKKFSGFFFSTEYISSACHRLLQVTLPNEKVGGFPDGETKSQRSARILSTFLVIILLHYSTIKSHWRTYNVDFIMKQFDYSESHGRL